jgi:acyl-CoA synthetase (AMP-forming)/AMP-acid ligase II
VRRGCGAAFSVETGAGERAVIVQEIRPDEDGVDEIIQAIRRAVAREHELHLFAVALIPARTIFKTSSGKLRRFECREAFLEGRLGVIAEWRESERRWPA